jgi:hypothetical protein
MRYLLRSTALVIGLITSAMLFVACGTSDANTRNDVLPTATIQTFTATLVVSPTPLANDVTSYISTRLSQKSVPVKRVDILNQNPLGIEVVLQSTSGSDRIAPDDAISQAIAQQETIAALRHGFTIDNVKITVENAQGKAIVWSELPIDTILNAAVTVPSKVDNTAVERDIHAQVPSDLDGVTLQTLDVALNEDQAQVIQITLSARDIDAANGVIERFMQPLSGTIQQLIRVKGASIASYRVDVVNNQGQPFLRYIGYTLGSNELRTSWWQADGVTQNWFPHPVPAQGSPDSLSPTPTKPYPAPSQ